MNDNIFSPKGKLDSSTFIIYHILLTVLYFAVGLLFFPLAQRSHIHPLFVMVLLLLINVFVMFNYKKRIFDIINNLFWAFIIAFILTFDHLLLSYFINQKSHILFYVIVLLVFCIQPIIVALFPSREV